MLHTLGKTLLTIVLTKQEDRPQNTLNFLEEVEKHDFDIFKSMTNDS